MKNFCTLVVVIVAMVLQTQAQAIFIRNFTGASACPTNGNPDTSGTGWSSVAVNRSTMTCTNTANVFNSTTLNNTASINTSSYIEYGITAVTGYQLNLTSTSFLRQASNTAPNSFQIRYSTDNFATFTDFGSVINTPTSSAQFTWNFASAITSTNSVQFRIYPFGTTRADGAAGASSGTGTFRIDDLTISGSVTAQAGTPVITPNPASLSGFCATTLAASTAKTVDFSGADLSPASSSIGISLNNADYELSKDGITYNSTLSYNYIGGSLANQTFYVRLKGGLTVGSKSATVTIAGGGDSKTVTLAGNVTNAPTIAVSDISFIGHRTGDPDQIAFATWIDLPANTEVFFTDNAFDENGAIKTNEQTILWRSPNSIISAGTVILGSFPSSGAESWSLGTTVSGNSLNGLAGAGDNIFAYQGSAACPAFIHGVSTQAWITTGSPNTNNSYLPAALNTTNGNVVSGNNGNFEYTGIRACNTFPNFKSLITNASNWGAVSGANNLNTTAFVPGIGVTISVSPSSRIENDNTGVTITATACSAVPSDVTVTLTYTGTATKGTDYTASNTITITAGNTTGTTTINNIDDSVFEGDETVIITISNVSGGGATIGTPFSTTYTIIEDDPAVYYSCNSGLTNAAIWSTDANCLSPLPGVAAFNSIADFIVQSGHTIEIQSSPLTLRNLTIQSGGQFWRNSTSTGNARFINLHGNLVNNGTFGNSASSYDAIGINIEGANTTISGSGVFNFGRIRKNSNAIALSRVTISNCTVNLRFPGTSLYNNAANADLLVTIASGATVNVPDGSVAIDGSTGLSVVNSFGSITVNGTLNIGGRFLGMTNNTTVGVCSLSIGNTGRVIVDTFDFNNNVAGAATNFALNMVGNGTLEIRNVLHLIGGTFTGNDKVILLSPTTDKCAIIDNFSPGCNGTFTGTITAQRYYESASAPSLHKQHFFSSPINNLAITQFAPAKGTNGVAVTPKANCDEMELKTGSNYGNVFEYNEAIVTACHLDGWLVRSTGNATNGSGYSVVKVGTGTLSLTGEPNFGNYSIPNLANSGWTSPQLTPQGNSYSSGWHLLGNPYAASLDLDYAVNADFEDAVQVLETHGPNAGTFQPVLMSSGAIVAPFQGFFAKKAIIGGTATFNIYASGRRTAQATFHKTNEHQLALRVNGNGFGDVTYFNFNQAATNTYDREFDAGKLPSFNGQPTLYSIIGGEWASINTLEDVTQSPQVSVGFVPGANGTFQFQAIGFDALPNTSVYLEDKKTAAMHNLTAMGDYTFQSLKTDQRERFELHFNYQAPSTISINPSNAIISIFSNHNKVIVDLSKVAGQTSSTSIEVFNLMGEKILGTSTIEKVFAHSFENIGIGYVVVKAQNGMNTTTKKVFVVSE